MKQYKTELILFFAALILRLVALVIFLWIAQQHHFIFFESGSDSQSYIALAKNMLDRGEFTRFSSPPFLPETFRTPGYPLFISFFLLLFGNIIAVSFAQAILAGLTAVIVYRLGRELFSHRVGIASAALFIVDPVGIYLAGQILSETTFTLFLLLSVYFFIENTRKYSRAHFIAAGLFLGCATLIRPVGQLLPFVYVGLYILSSGFGRKGGRSISLLLFAAAFLVVVAPWSLRNKILFNSWQLSDVGIHNFYWYHVPAFYVEKNNVSERDIREQFEKRRFELDPAATKHVSIRDIPFQSQIVFDYIREDPLAFAEFYAVKTIPFFISDGLIDILRDLRVSAHSQDNLSTLLFQKQFRELFRHAFRKNIESVIFLAGVAFWLFINVLMVIGLVAGFYGSRHTRIACILFFTIVIFMAALSGPVSNARIRYPVTALMFVLASYGFGIAVEKLTTSRKLGIILYP